MRLLKLVLLYFILAVLIITNVYIVILCITAFKGTVALLFYGYIVGFTLVGAVVLTTITVGILIIIDKIKYRERSKMK